MKISILHPFTAEAVGLKEKELLRIHSQPHFHALKYIAHKLSYTCYMDYFTSNRQYNEKRREGIIIRFFPVNFKFSGDHRKWKKQESDKCLKIYKKNPPDLTVINMSGHSSPFSYDLSQLIKDKGKEYVAMLGGQHYSDNPRNRSYYEGAHHILVHTESQKNEMRNMEMFQGADIKVFPLGVDCSFFKPNNNKQNGPSLIYVGRIVEWKRIELALEAVRKLRDNNFSECRLNIIGPISSEKYYRELTAYIERHGLKKHVTFLGPKKHDELPLYFRKTDLFCLPSHKETFGMVMVEAMACGVPVAAIDCPGGPAEVISDGVNGILTSVENYGDSILSFFKNKEGNTTMGLKARAKIEKNYSLEDTHKALKRSVEIVAESLNCQY